MKLGVIITTFNRPQYLRQCLASVRAADLSQVQTVLIVDDKSTEQETIQLINDFELEGVELIKAFSKENRSIKGSLLFGLDLLFQSCDVVTNLDGDAIVTPDAFNRLLKLREQFPGYILTGFNCSTKNRNGTVRHKILEQGEGWNKKYSVGGINMMFDALEYFNIIKPALQKCITQGGNWDHQSCILSNTLFNKPIVVLEPSCVQHIGIESSMGHSTGGEPPDEAEDFVYEQVGESEITAEDVKAFKNELDKANFSRRSFYGFVDGKLYLPDVTLICADGVDVERCIHAANISCRDIEFGAVKILSHLPSDDPRVIPIRPLLDKKDYSQFILKEIVDYVDTEFMLIFQFDGFVLNASAWMPQFLMYDMVGASWKFRPEKRTANGGFSLRSRKMMKAIQEDPKIFLRNDHIITNFAEDHVLFYIYREYLEEKHKIYIAPENICDWFSIEAWGVKPPGNKYSGSFGFHGFNVDFSEAKLSYIPYRLPNRKILPIE